MNHLENRLMIAAFVIGMGLQLLVTEVPYFVVLFGTCRLTLLEWVKLLVLASMPLFAHELLVFGSCLGEKVNRENRKRSNRAGCIIRRALELKTFIFAGCGIMRCP